MQAAKLVDLLFVFPLIKQFSCGVCIWFVGFIFISPSAYVFSQASLGPAWGSQVQSVFLFFIVQMEFLKD